MTVQIYSNIEINKKRDSLKKEQSLELSYIESQLSEMGIPFTPISWTDRFLIAEKLQNYFAEILAGYSLLELMEEDKKNPDVNKIEIWDKNKYQQFFETFSPEAFSNLASEVMGAEQIKQA